MPLPWIYQRWSPTVSTTRTAKTGRGVSVAYQVLLECALVLVAVGEPYLALAILLVRGPLQEGEIFDSIGLERGVCVCVVLMSGYLAGVLLDARRRRTGQECAHAMPLHKS